LFTDCKGKDEQALAACIELACFAYLRRKFIDLSQANHTPMAKEALERITLLNEVEAGGKNLRIEGRQQLHKEKSLPVLNDLQTF
jgi:transposase